MSSEISVLVSSPPVLTTLITGLLIAFAFQLLLTNFGIAAGITALGYRPDSNSQSKPSEANKSVIGFAVGASTLLTINLVLFVACFLAVELSAVASQIHGAILGIVIWAAYLLILVWVSSSAVSSLLGSLLTSLTSGLQSLISTVTSAIAPKNNSAIPDALREQIAAQESTLNTLQRELSAASSPPATIQDSLQNYLKTLSPPQLDLQTIRDEFADLLSGSDLTKTARGLVPAHLDRQALMEIVRSRTDFSESDIASLVEQLEAVWQETMKPSSPQQQLAEFLRSASPDLLTSGALNQQLAKWLPQQAPVEAAEMLNLAALDFKQLAGLVLKRVDLSDVDVGKVLGQLRSVLQGRSAPDVPINLIQADIEDYLLNAYPWQLTRKTVKQEFKDVIYDPEADPIAIQKQLEPLDHNYLISLLQQRHDLTPAKIDKISDRLEAVRQDVLELVQKVPEDSQQSHGDAKMLWQKLENYATDLSEKLTAKNIQRHVKALLKDCNSELKDLQHQLPAFDRSAIEQRLTARQDLSKKRIQQVADQFEKAWSHLSQAASETPAKGRTGARAKTMHHASITVPISSAPRRFALRTQTKLQDFQEKLTDYLRNTDKEELNPESIQHDLNLLLNDPQAGISNLNDRLSQIDRSTLIALLAQRQDLTTEEATQIVEQVESTLQRFTEQMQQVQQHVQTTIAHTLTQVRDRVATLELPELDYDHLKQELQTLLASPASLETLGRRLSEFNRDTLSEWLKSRQDISESLAHQITDRVDAVRTTILQQAEHLQQETQQRVEDLKQQAQRQAEDARRAIAIAAWWLFGTALTSAISAAIAGVLAVRYFL